MTWGANCGLTRRLFTGEARTVKNPTDRSDSLLRSVDRNLYLGVVR